MQVCNRESKCKKIAHKITSKSVFVTSITIHSKNNMALISHTHPGNSRAMPDEGLFVWSRALPIIGGDVLAIHLLFEYSIWFPFIFSFLYFIYPVYSLHSLCSLHFLLHFFFILSSLLTFFCHPLLTDAQHAAQSPLRTLNQCISIPDIRT